MSRVPSFILERRGRPRDPLQEAPTDRKVRIPTWDGIERRSSRNKERAWSGKLAVTLLGFLALVGYGVSLPELARRPSKEVLADLRSNLGREILLTRVRVVSAIPERGFVGECAGVQATFLSDLPAQGGEELSVRGTVESAGIQVLATRPYSGTRSLRWLVFVVSAAVALGAAWNLFRHFSWIRGAFRRVEQRS